MGVGSTQPLEPIVPTFPVKRWTADQYVEMIRAGILTEYDRVELIDGVIVPTPRAGPDHNRGVAKLNRLFRPAEDSYFVLIQGTIQIDGHNVCDPDVALVGPSAMEVEPARHPFGSEVDLVVEVADSSLKQDREKKSIAYAKAGVHEYWIVDLKGRLVWILREPVGGEYRSVVSVGAEGVVSPAKLPTLSLSVSDFLPG